MRQRTLAVTLRRRTGWAHAALLAGLLLAFCAAPDAHAQAEASVTPASLDFPATHVGATSAALTVTLENSGDETLDVGTPAVVGDDSFAIAAETCPAELPQAGTCTVDVTFAPTAAGPASAILRIPTEVGDRDVALTGTGTAPTADRSPAGLSFTAQVGTTSAPQTVTLTNNGNEPLTIGTITRDGAGAARFAVADETCPAELPAQASCTIDVTFSPTGLGAVGANLVIPTEAGERRVTLTGTGTAEPPPPAPVAEVSPASLSFAAQAGTTSGALRVTLTNSGNAPLNITAIGPEGADAPRFGIRVNTCGQTLAAGDSCVVDVVFAPAAVGDFFAVLRFHHDAAVSTQDVTLRGTGTAAPLPPPPPPPPPAVLDGDGDGVLGVQDLCPNQRGIRTDGCPDGDGDGTSDRVDACVAVPGDLTNGCQRELNADIRGVWRVNRRLTKMLTLFVRAPTGSKIAVRCASKRRRVCPFRLRFVRRTERRTTSLVRFFRKARILPAGTLITVRVTRRGRLGTYERLRTRSGRRLPRVTQRCIDHRERAIPCP